MCIVSWNSGDVDKCECMRERVYLNNDEQSVKVTRAYTVDIRDTSLYIEVNVQIGCADILDNYIHVLGLLAPYIEHGIAYGSNIILDDFQIGVCYEDWAVTNTQEYDNKDTFEAWVRNALHKVVVEGQEMNEMYRKCMEMMGI